MSKVTADKHQILVKGGVYQESVDTVESWLNFLTNPFNLKPGLPKLTVTCINSLGNFGSFKIHVTFSETNSSLKTLHLELDHHDEVVLPVFQETDPERKDAKLADTNYAAVNPHCLRDWIFGLFKQSELEYICIQFLNTALPDLFDQLPNLKTLNIYRSKIGHLPPSFYRLPALVHLDISESGFAEVPAELGRMQSLRSLTFSQPCSPSVLGSLRGLTILNCKSSNFNVPDEITQLVNLKQLSFNHVASAPGNFLNFPRLEYLYFHVSGNRSAFIFPQANLPRLKKLNTNHPAAFASSISSFHSLEDFTTGEGLDKPHELSLSASELDTLVNSLRQLNALRRINLEGLGITDMEFCLSHPNIEYIYLSRNRIVNVPAGADKLSKLKKLDLRKNAITHVPAELFRLFDSGVLNLKDNPILNHPDSDLINEVRKKIIQRGGAYTMVHEKGESILGWLSFLSDPLNLQPGLPDITISTDYIYFEDSTITVSFDKHNASLCSLKLELNGPDEDNTSIFFDDIHTNTAESKTKPDLKKWVFNLFLHTDLQELHLPLPQSELPDLFARVEERKSRDR